MKNIILSIKPKYADLILCGEKTIELRRRANFWKGTILYLYATAPTRAIVGKVAVERRSFRLSTWAIMDVCTVGVCLSIAEIGRYLGDVGIITRLSSPMRLITPVEAEGMTVAGVNIPQSYRFIDEGTEQLISEGGYKSGTNTN